MTTALAGLVTATTVISYLFVYTPLKRRPRCARRGRLSRRASPVTGWVAATGSVDPGAIVLFALLFFWQLPHALAIAQLYREDYDRAGIRMLPTVDRERGSTGRQALLNCMALLCVGLLPAAIGIAGLGHRGRGDRLRPAHARAVRRDGRAPHAARRAPAPASRRTSTFPS